MANHPIFAPTFHGDVASVTKILDADPSLVSVRDAKNLTPLHVAASRGQAHVVQLLLDYGADVDGPTQQGEWTPIVFAAYRGHLDAVKTLKPTAILGLSGQPQTFTKEIVEAMNGIIGSRACTAWSLASGRRAIWRAGL